jgi:hypothetical protein
MLVKVNSKDTQTVVKALTKRVQRLPAQLRRSLTWDRGLEMAAHKKFSIATDAKVYFCVPQSPWQRGTNENTNRLGSHPEVLAPKDVHSEGAGHPPSWRFCFQRDLLHGPRRGKLESLRHGAFCLYLSSLNRMSFIGHWRTCSFPSTSASSIAIWIYSSVANRRCVLRRISRAAFSAAACFSMDLFSSRSPEPSLWSPSHFALASRPILPHLGRRLAVLIHVYREFQKNLDASATILYRFT